MSCSLANQVLAQLVCSGIGRNPRRISKCFNMFRESCDYLLESLFLQCLNMFRERSDHCIESCGKSRLLGSDVPLECGLCRSYFRLHRWSQPEFCSGQRRVCFFLEFLRTRVRRAHRPQLLCRQDHVHKRLRDLSCFYVYFYCR